MKIRLSKKTGKKFLGGFFFVIVSLLILDYLPCDIYNFQPPKKFTGNFIYNPYKQPFSNWDKVNFHAHSVAWDGITNGKQPTQTVLNDYLKNGYTYSCVSNYESLAKEGQQSNSITVYEHGWNISKTHHLVIMPNKVYYQDFPLFQSASIKQFVIKNLEASAKVIALPHPVIRDGYSDEDLKKLTGYNLMEVLNHSANSSNKWDVALSAGKAVWIIGDDDTHDITDTNQTFTNWTMINCMPHNKDSIVNDLKNGNAYAVNGRNGINDNALMNVAIDSLSFSVQLQNKADSIKFIGQDGVVEKITYNTNNAGYTFFNSDSYIRTVVYNKRTTMFLNPLIRYNGKDKPSNTLTASINYNQTFLYRSLLVISWCFLFIIMNPAAAKQILWALKRRRQKWLEYPDFA